ncbi:MAG: FAD-dependent oxidoreductase, partial [Armatimonadetes bacterium]|nr:FAD-dependent oxidoreductase [Armatimonadota bacterium]
AGRRSNLGGLNAEAVGLEVDRRGLVVGEAVDRGLNTSPPAAECPGSALRTNIEHIYAIGDCIRGIGLAHVAMHEAVAAVDDSRGLAATINYRAVPTAMYCNPEITSVGLVEWQAREAGLDYVVGSFPFAANGRAVAMGARDGFVKIVAAREDDRVLGATVVGSMGTELLAELTMAVRMGLPLEEIAETIHAHPTLSEAVHEAALGALGRPLHIPAE